MNHPAFFRSHLYLRHIRLLLLLLVLLPSSLTATFFQVNDDVKLVRDTPLFYLNSELRTGKLGETFKVLTYKSDAKKVFLATTDSSGKKIAVSVNEDALVLIPIEKAKVQADVLAAVTQQQFGLAKTICVQALRARPDDFDILNIFYALEKVIKNFQQLNRASDAQKLADVEIKRLRRNAEIIDHINPLNTNDHSGQECAKQIRTQAEQTKMQSEQNTHVAQTDYVNALSTLKITIEHLSAAATLQTPVSEIQGSASNTTLAKSPLATTRSQEFSNWNDLSFVNTREINEPKFAEYLDANDVPLTFESQAFLQAIGLKGEASANRDLQLFTRLQSAALNLQIPSMSLAKYMTAWQKVYESNGYDSGRFVAEILLDGFNTALGTWKRAISSDDLILRHVDKCIDATTHNTFVSETSSYMLTLRRCAIMYSKMTPNELNGMTIGEEFGNLTIKESIAEIQKARHNQDNDRAKKMLARLFSVLTAKMDRD